MNRLRLPVLWLLPLPLQGCLFECVNEEVGRAASPGGKYVAAVFIRDCGATTDFSTQVAIVPAGEDIPELGNVYRATAGSAPRTEGGWFPVGVRWLGPDRLQITFAAGAEEFLRLNRFSGATVEYRVAATAGSSVPGT